MENPQGQVSFLKRRRRVTTTPSGPKVTVSTEAPGMASILLNAVVARTCPPGLSVCCSKLRKPTGPARARRACQRWTFRALSIDLSGCSFTRASAPKSAKNYPWEPEESRKKDDYLIGKLKAWRKDHKSASFQLPFRKLT